MPSPPESMIMKALLLLGLCIFAACLYGTIRRIHRAHSRSARLRAAAIIPAVIVLGVVNAMMVLQIHLMEQENRFLHAAITAYAPAQNRIIPNPARSEGPAVSCAAARATVRQFETTFVFTSDWHGHRVLDHGAGAILAFGLQQSLQARGCITASQATRAFDHLREQRQRDAAARSALDRLVMTPPMGFIPGAPSMREAFTDTWKNLSPRVFAMQECLGAAIRHRPSPISPARVHACRLQAAAAPAT